MTKLWDIINAATGLGEWKVLDQGKSVGTPQYDVCHAPKQEFSKNTEALIEYIATFDPEHIALMLKKDALSDDICRDVCEWLSPHTDAKCLSCPLLKFLHASIALRDYRRGRGLNG